MTKHDAAYRRLNGRRVVVLGMGRSGIAATRFLAKAGAHVTCNDAREEALLAAARRELATLTDVEWVCGGHPDELFEHASLVVVSPGVPADLPALATALLSGAEVIGEVELAFRHLRAPLVAITGTNGKSTTTAWCAEMLQNDGKDVFVGGNLGTPLVEAALRHPPPDVVVAEISSFQMEWVLEFRPRIGAVTNVAPDHLDRHGSLSAYRAAKLRLLARQREGDAAITPPGFFDDLFETHPADHFRFRLGGLLRPGAGEMGEGIVLLGMPRTGAETYDTQPIRLPGPHNRQNAMVALLCARLAGASMEAAAAGLYGFDGLAHRLELVAELDGVRWYNDSKATNVASARIAARSFDAPLVWIAGGRGKGASYEPILTELRKPGHVRMALLIGEAAGEIADAIGKAFDAEQVSTLQRAVLRARDLAQPGDVVLFSPACASFDQFTNFEERGHRFRELVGRFQKEVQP